MARTFNTYRQQVFFKTGPKPVLLCDVDDVAVPTAQIILDYYQRLTGDYSTEHTRISSGNDYGVMFPQWSTEDLIDLVNQEEFFDMLYPLEDAVKSLQRLSKKYEIAFYTAQWNHGRHLKIRFLNKFFTFIQKVLFSEVFAGKTEHTGEVFIDNMPDNLIYNQSRRRILFNCSGCLMDDLPDGIEQCRTWDEIIALLID